MNDEELIAKLEQLRGRVVPLAENTVTRYIGQCVDVGVDQRPLMAAALAELFGEAAAEMCGFTSVENVVQALGLVIQALADGHENIGVTMLVGEEAEAYNARQQAPDAAQQQGLGKFVRCPDCQNGEQLADYDDGGQWVRCTTCCGLATLPECPTCKQHVSRAQADGLGWPEERRDDL